MIDGVSASCLALPALPPSGNVNTLLADYLAERLPAVGAAQWLERMVQGRVLDEQGQALPPHTTFAHVARARLQQSNLQHAHQNHSRLYYYRAIDGEHAEPELPFEVPILFQDAHLLVADKPHFMPVTPTGRYVQQSLMVQLKRKTGIDTLNPIHRIDRETAGLVVFSVQPQERDAYHALFRTPLDGKPAVEKVYEAIAPILPTPLPMIYRSRIEANPEHFFRQCEVPGEPNSETALELVEARPPSHALYRLRPKSGKTHQLRVHMNALGRPITGDLFYPDVVHGPAPVQEDWTDPLRLLARSLRFIDPVTAEERHFQSRRELVWPAPGA